MPRSQRDMLMQRKDAIYNPDKTTKPRQTLTARQLRRMEEKKSKTKVEKNNAP